MQNIIVTVFKVESEGFQAISELRNNPKTGGSFVSEAVLIKKEAGSYTVTDGFDTGSNSSDDTLLGTMVGMCVGVLGGPIGMLLGAGYGALVGMTLDTIDVVDDVSMLEQIADKLDDGMVAMIALAEEETPAPLDAQLNKYDTVIARFDAAVVAQEVEMAREMQADMERQAKAQLRKQKSDEFKAKVEERRAKIKETLNKEIKLV
jgi:uncharacterized membrane protein